MIQEITFFAGGPSSDDEGFEDRLAVNGFLGCAARYWGAHSGQADAQIKEAALTFHRGKSLASSASQALLVSLHQPPSYSGYSQVSSTEMTMVHLLAYFALEEFLAYVLGHGAEPDAKDSQGRTPLSWAARYNAKELVKLLLAQDSMEVNSKDSAGRTPLCWAVGSGSEEVVKLLLARGDVEADSKDSAGRTPLFYAVARRGSAEEMALLLLARDHLEADSKDYIGRTPLFYMVTRPRSKRVVQSLLARDDVNADPKDFRGHTPLFWAERHGPKEVIKLLLAGNHLRIVLFLEQ